MSKIESLTQQQQSRLSIIGEKWIAIGLSTDRVDRGTAERALHAAYKSAGKSPPRFLIMLRSPLEACLAVALIRSGSAQVIDQVINQVSAQVRDQVRAQVSAQVRNQVITQVINQVRDQVRDQVINQVRAQISDQVRDQVRDQV